MTDPNFIEICTWLRRGGLAESAAQGQVCSVREKVSKARLGIESFLPGFADAAGESSGWRRHGRANTGTRREFERIRIVVAHTPVLDRRMNVVRRPVRQSDV